MRVLLAALLAVFVVSCTSSGPAPIAYGTDQCAACRMTITDQTYAAELITSTGKAYKFDSPECMLGYYRAGTAEPKENVAALYVTNFVSPGTLIDARTAFYHHSEHLHSPMGMNVSAFATDDARKQAAMHWPGEPHTFKTVLTMAEDYE